MPRPPREIDYDGIRDMAQEGCTDYEIADIIGFSQEGFSRRKSKDDKLQQALKRGRSVMNRSLRRAQLDSALGGNVTAQIWLGKQVLGQKDKHEQTVDGTMTVNIIKPDRSKR